VPTAISVAGETERAFDRESSQRGREDRKENLLVVVKRSEVEIFALIGVLLCILMWLKSVATPLAAVSRYSLTRLAVNSVPLACILSNQFNPCFLA
jgi:hypothetical protein